MKRYFRWILVGLMLAAPVQAMSLDREDSVGTFLRTDGFEHNYRIMGEVGDLPSPPSFHLNLQMPTVFGQVETLPVESYVTSYVFRTVERVFAQMVGDEPSNPFAGPTYHLIGDKPLTPEWHKRTAH